MNETMTALRFDGTLALVTDAPRPARPSEALVRVLAAGICNTDIEITHGYAGFCGIPGHEFVGRVEAAADKDLIGQRVVGEINAGCGQCALCQSGDTRHCPTRTVLGIVNRDGAFAEYLSLPSGNLLIVPDTIPDEVAVFSEPLAAACSILEQVTLQPKDRVAVIGDGKLGLLIAQVLKLTGCQLVLVGKHLDKLAIARQQGIETVQAAELSDQSGKFDCVVEASGADKAMIQALDLVRPRGKIVLKSTYAGMLTLDAARVVVNEISIVGSRCGRLADALRLLTEGRVDVQSLISNIFPLSQGVPAFTHAQQPGVLKVLLKP
ncbi:MAG: alcohol dehydrogenase catalytic domain-containing protein [Acidobacteriota bacterium]